MVENIYRQLARRHGTEYRDQRRHLRRGVGSEPSDRLRDGRDRRRLPADLRAHRSVGQAVPPDGRHDDLRAARIARCSRSRSFRCSARRAARRREGARESRCSSGFATGTRRGLDWCLAHRGATVAASVVLFAVSLGIAFTRGGEFMPKLDEGALWVRATMPYTISFEESSKIVPQVRAILAELPRSHGRRVGARSRRRRHRSDGILQRRVLCRAEAVRRVEWRVPLEGSS